MLIYIEIHQILNVDIYIYISILVGLMASDDWLVGLIIIHQLYVNGGFNKWRYPKTNGEEWNIPI